MWGGLLTCHLLSETFWPSLQAALPSVRVPGWEGQLGSCELGGPLILMKPGSRAGVPAWLVSYDLVAPITGVPLGPLRAGCQAWVQERSIRLLMTLPFLYGDRLAERWSGRLSQRLTELLGVDSLYLLLPGPALWHLAFDALPEAEWAAQSASAVWDLRAGTVRFADGIHTREAIRDIGLPLEEWFKQSKLPAWNPEAFLKHPQHTQFV